MSCSPRLCLGIMDNVMYTCTVTLTGRGHGKDPPQVLAGLSNPPSFQPVLFPVTLGAGTHSHCEKGARGP